jgi:TonB-dependent starch-binding outer membrane protein SusC
MINHYLKKLFKPSAYCWAGTNKFLSLGLALLILVLINVSSAQAQETTVQGTVTDDKGEPLIGVIVKVKDAQGGVSTDINGKYSIKVPGPNSVLVFNYIGFNNQEQRVGNRRVINVKLIEDAVNLNEVVVVGYGTQRKPDLTGAINVVGAADIAKRQAIDVLDALQGQAPGLQIAQESGEPGAGNSVRVRGIGTLQAGSNPLYIVDGAQTESIEGINPNDIESITVLKDAASAAIYGSRSANGVILITTKKGKEGKPRINASFLQSYSKLANKVPQSTAAQRRLYEMKLGGSGVQVDSLNPSFNADIDHQDLITRTAQRNEFNLSVSGGTKALNYYGSFGYLNDEGIILNSYSNIARARFNVDYEASPKFTYRSRIGFSYQEGNGINVGNTLNQAIQRIPTFRIFMPDGTLAPTLGGRRNPLAQALLRVNKQNEYNTSLFNALEYRFTDDLKLTLDGNVQLRYDHGLQFEPALLAGNMIDTNGADNTEFETYWMTQAYMNYDKTFKKDHQFIGMLGVAADKRNNRRKDFDASGYSSEEVITLNSAAITILTDATATAKTSASVFGRLGYNYKSRYIFNSNFRLDGASVFGRESRWGFFPSAAFTWRLTDEPFMNWSDKFLSDAKVRLSYGQTGNDRIDTYASIQRYTFGREFYNGSSGIVPNSQFGNNQLSWETNTQTNAGLDLTFFNGKLSLVTDYYVKTTTDLLYEAPLATELGYSEVQVNVGSLRNRGFEFILSAFPLRNPKFQWDVSYNMSFNNATIRKLYNGTPLLSGGGRWKYEEGGRLGEFFGWKHLGVYQYDASNAYTDNWERLTPVNVSADGKTAGGYLLNGAPYSGPVNQLKTNGAVLKGGDVIWDNINKDGVIDDADKMSLGNAQPKFIAGLSNSFRYRDFGLSFNIYTSWGGKIYNDVRRNLNTYNTTNVTPEPYVIENSWLKQGDVTDVPRAQRNNPVVNVRDVSSAYIEDASFIRLRNVKLSYNLPLALTSRVKLQNVGVYVYGANLATWTNYKWYDPEIAFNNNLEMGRDTGRYPREREFGLGLNVNF